jgi:hypothetical protein
MYEHVNKKKKNLFFTLWYRGPILLAETKRAKRVAVRKMADLNMMIMGLVSFKLNTPRI